MAGERGVMKVGSLWAYFRAPPFLGPFSSLNGGSTFGYATRNIAGEVVNPLPVHLDLELGW